jgi:hypothetical protein
MMKKYLYGLAVVAALSAPLSAEELYVRNRAFGDAYFVAGTTYVPASSFLKALDVAWSDNGASVSLGSGESPDSAFDSEAVTLTHGGKTLDLSGMLRGGKLYVPAKSLATFVGYTVINNPETGIVDVVKSREYTSADAAAEQEVAAAGQAAKDARKAEREARQAKEKALADAKAEAEAKAKGETTEEGTESTEGKEGEETASKPTETAPATPPEATPPAAPETPKEPPKANLVVLSSDADPNYYTGECIFRGVVQNQGFAPAEGISAAFSVTGPDGRVWVSKTLYRGPLAVDGRWEISETYKHPLASAMPRGSFTVSVVPKFTSAIVPETK